MDSLRTTWGRFVATLAALTGAASAQSTWFGHEGESSNLGYGYAVAQLGDLDLDGVDDYVVGAYKKGGFADVRSGRTGEQLFYLHETGCFGMGLVGLGDVNDDGVPDFAVGSPREVLNCLSCGVVRVYSGADASVLRIFEGERTKQRFGYSLSAADVTGDGVLDLVVGSFWDEEPAYEAGSADVFDVVSGLHLYEVTGDETVEEWFGTDVVGMGDLDGDGYEDFAVGAPRQWYVPAKHPPAGAVHVFSGRFGFELYTLRGEQAGDCFGTSIGRIGDLNGDGRSELAVGSPRHRVDDVEVGCVDIYSGANGAFLTRWTGTPLSKFGTSVDSAGDFDGDGTDDVVLGACTCQNTFPMGQTPGRIEVRSGASGALLAQMDGAAAESYGFAVTGLGDVTGDAVPDFLVGATWAGSQGPHTGRAEVVSGATLSLTTDTHLLSASEGGSQVLELDGGAGLAHVPYVLLGTSSGVWPGFATPTTHVPLNPDVTTLLELANLNSPSLVDFVGSFDASGAATARIQLPGGLPPAIVGTTLHHAWVSINPWGGIETAGTPAPLTLIW